MQRQNAGPTAYRSLFTAYFLFLPPLKPPVADHDPVFLTLDDGPNPGSRLPHFPLGEDIKIFTADLEIL